MDKLRVVLLFGGRSSEHSISCATAGGVLRAIDRDRYEVIPVGITRDGAFVLEADDPDAVRPRPRAPARGRRQRHPGALARERGVARADGDGCRGRALARRRRRRVPDPARPVRRGRHRAGAARARRAAVRRQRRARVGDRHGQALHEDRARGRRASRSRRGSRSRARRWPPTASCGTGGRAALGLPVFVKPARAGSSVGVSEGRGLVGARRRARRRVRRGPHGARRVGRRRPRDRVRRARGPLAGEVRA